MRKKRRKKKRLLTKMPEVKTRKPTAPGTIVIRSKKKYKRSRDKKKIERNYDKE